MVLGLPRPILRVFSLVRLPTKTAREFFSGSFSNLDHFLKEMALSSFFLLLEPVQCLAIGKTFLYLIYCLVT